MNYKSIFIVLFFICSRSYATSISLRVIDADGYDLKQVGVGQPFVIEVTIHDCSRGIQEPTIAKLNTINGRRTSVRIQTINGVSTTHYTYEARIDRPGEYIIGPATEGSMHITSESVHIAAGDAPIAAREKSKNRTTKTVAFLRFEIDENQVFVGQKINCTLRFYYLNNVMSVDNPEIPDCIDFLKSVLENQNKEQKEAIIDHQTYKYLEWNWSLYPQQPGKKILPACSVNFEIQNSHRNNFFNLFMGGRGELKRVYSNSIPLFVHELPPSPYLDDVKAIGSFTAIKAELNRSVVKQGDAALLTIEIEGEGNFDMIDKFALLNIPQSCKFYESKNIFEKNKTDGLSKKRFEFIIQGLTPGHWQIPPQEFTYFDTKTKKYTTMKTVPLPITIVRSPSSIHNVSPSHGDSDNTQKNEPCSIDPMRNLKILHKKTSDPIGTHRSLPMALFFFMMGIPIALLLMNKCRTLYTRWHHIFLTQLLFQNAYRSARKKLKYARKTKDIASLYILFIQLIAQRNMMAQTALCQSVIIELLQSKQIPSHLIQEWDQFFEHLTLYRFGNDTMNEQTHYDLFNRAEQWINRLQKII